MFGLNSKSLEDLGLLGENLGIVFWSSVYITQNLQRLIVTSFLIAIPRRLGEAENKYNNDLEAVRIVSPQLDQEIRTNPKSI